MKPHLHSIEVGTEVKGELKLHGTPGVWIEFLVINLFTPFISIFASATLSNKSFQNIRSESKGRSFLNNMPKSRKVFVGDTNFSQLHRSFLNIQQLSITFFQGFALSLINLFRTSGRQKNALVHVCILLTKKVYCTLAYEVVRWGRGWLLRFSMWQYLGKTSKFLQDSR